MTLLKEVAMTLNRDARMPTVKLDVVDGPVALQQYGPYVQDVLLEQVRDEGVPLVLVG